MIAGATLTFTCGITLEVQPEADLVQFRSGGLTFWIGTISEALVYLAGGVEPR